MEDKQSTINATGTIVFPTHCGPESIRRLKPDLPFDPPLVDAIVSMTKPPESGPTPVYLGAKIHTEMKKSGFGKTKSLVSNIPRDRSWIIGVYESDHWSAVSIDWQDVKIGYYDPNNFRAKEQRGKVTDVSTNPFFFLSKAHVLFQRIQKWIEHICDGNACRVWDVVWRFGPLQDKGDAVNCGVFTTLTLCRWLYAREVEDQVGDPIKYRKEFVALVSKRLKDGTGSK
jgi:hypothetical protein